MRTLQNKSLRKLTDKKLIHGLEKLRGEERRVLVDVLYYLIEIERRQLYLPRGYSSLFEFCTEYLKYSRSAAGRRIRAARCVKEFPEVAGMLLRGELNLCVVSLVSGVLTTKNHRDILLRIRGKSYREVELLVAKHRPRELVRDRVKPVYIKTELKIAPNVGSISDEGNSCSGNSGENFTPNVGSSADYLTTGYSDKRYKSSSDVGTRDQDHSRMVLEQKFKLEFAVDPEFMATLEKLKALLSTKYPKGLDFERLFKILMDDYLDHHSPEGRIKRRKQQAESKGKSRTKLRGRVKDTKTPGQTKRAKLRVKTKNAKSCARSTGSRYISQPVRDEVFMRDSGRCTYVGLDGKRCDEKWNLQIDHVVPFAMGGDNSVDNLRLLCADHNILEAEKAYGKKHMEQFHRRE